MVPTTLPSANPQVIANLPHNIVNSPSFSRRSVTWERRLRHRVMLADAIAIYLSVLIAFALHYGIGELADWSPTRLTNHLAFAALGLIVVWYAALALTDSWDTKMMGVGAAEYARVSNVTFAVFGLLAIFSFLTRWNIGRSYVGIALPLGLIFINLSRWLMRVRLGAKRDRGEARYRTLLVGSPTMTHHLLSELERSSATGLTVVAICDIGSGRDSRPETGSIIAVRPRTSLPPDLFQSQSVNEVASYVANHDIDVVIVSGSDDLSPASLKRLAWELEATGADFVLAPGINDISNQRLRVRPTVGLPLLQVEAPGYTSSQQRLKRLFDMVGSTLLITIFAIPMAVVALLIKTTSPGPVLFRQTRIGINGQPLQVFKFRSMVVDAEARLSQVLNGEAGMYYKIKNDPRITPIGRFIRRYSIDELPQLFNVWFGTMSLVGPRPLTPHGMDTDQETAEALEGPGLYQAGVQRRLFVKPGMTGLWQVSGRNNLSVEESIRLDLYYVENWSMTEDLIILARTAKAVVGRDGAY